MKDGQHGERLLTVVDLARRLNCGLTKAREIVNSREIRTVRLGRLVRLEPEAVEEYIQNQRR